MADAAHTLFLAAFANNSGGVEGCGLAHDRVVRIVGHDAVSPDELEIPDCTLRAEPIENRARFLRE